MGCLLTPSASPHPAFPGEKLVGNDDHSFDDEKPYQAGSPVGVANDPYQSASQEALWSTDFPTFAISKGALNNTYQFHLQLQEFPRLEINAKWYRIGEQTAWRFRVWMRKTLHPTLNIEHWDRDPQVSPNALIQNNLEDFE
jgi:hypothetical protein